MFINTGKLLPCKTPNSYSKLEDYKTITSEEEIDGVYSLQYSPDGSVLAVGSGNEAMRVRIECVMAIINH